MLVVSHQANKTSLSSTYMFKSERDLRSCEVTQAVTNKAQKKFWGSNGIRTHDLRDTGAMLYRLSYEASPEALFVTA